MLVQRWFFTSFCTPLASKDARCFIEWRRPENGILWNLSESKAVVSACPLLKLSEPKPMPLYISNWICSSLWNAATCQLCDCSYFGASFILPCFVASCVKTLACYFRLLCTNIRQRKIHARDQWSHIAVYTAWTTVWYLFTWLPFISNYDRCFSEVELLSFV